jgi:hypothetical protein
MKNELRVFPVVSDGQWAYVSLYGEGFALANGLETKIRDAYHSRKEKDSPFFVEGDLVREVFHGAKISPEENLFWFLFDQPQEKKIAVKRIGKILLRPNEAGDGIFGTLGVDVGAAPAGGKSSRVIGLAFIGKESQLLASKAESPNFSEIQLNIAGEKALEHANSLFPVSAPDARELVEPLRFQAARVGGFEFIEARAGFKHKVPEAVPNAHQLLLGYFVRGEGATRALYDFYVDGDYSQAPEQVLMGKWLKGFDGTLYISSTGIGDCGLFVLLKSGAKPVAVPVRCGSWGC